MLPLKRTILRQKSCAGSTTTPTLSCPGRATSTVNQGALSSTKVQGIGSSGCKGSSCCCIGGCDPCSCDCCECDPCCCVAACPLCMGGRPRASTAVTCRVASRSMPWNSSSCCEPWPSSSSHTSAACSAASSLHSWQCRRASSVIRSRAPAGTEACPPGASVQAMCSLRTTCCQSPSSSPLAVCCCCCCMTEDALASRTW
mmetsp:Transcript_6730/g.18021  ORF Transcript_6730/g.18021 Transcript_6730/m.18021 type:complete len:200 (+) Transcript_6730:880-1479(+)